MLTSCQSHWKPHTGASSWNASSYSLKNYSAPSSRRERYMVRKSQPVKLTTIGLLQLLLGFDPSPSANIFLAACAAGLTSSVKFLIERGIDLNNPDEYGNFPLHFAAYYQRLNIVNALLKESADPNVKSSQYGDAIRSVLEGRLSYSVLKLDRDDLTDDSEYEDAIRSVLEGFLSYSLVKLDRDHLTEGIASLLPQNRIYTFLDWIEEIETPVKRIKESEVVVDSEGMTVFGSGYSLEAENVDHCSKLIQTLIDLSACPDSPTSSFGNHLHLAAYLGIGDWPQKFDRMGMDVSENCGYLETPLLAALIGHQISIAEFLIDSGANVSHISEQH
ncbi:unnamed protein product [Sphagnum balticum]